MIESPVSLTRCGAFVIMSKVTFWNGEKHIVTDQSDAVRLVLEKFPHAHFSNRTFRVLAWERESDRIGDYQCRYGVAEITPI